MYFLCECHCFKRYTRTVFTGERMREAQLPLRRTLRTTTSSCQSFYHTLFSTHEARPYPIRNLWLSCIQIRGPFWVYIYPSSGISGLYVEGDCDDNHQIIAVRLAHLWSTPIALNRRYGVIWLRERKSILERQLERNIPDLICSVWKYELWLAKV
jgi:hypothetical protein